MVDYEMRESLPGIFTVKVEDDYQRAMLFLRSQEHYESAFPEFRGHHFDVFTYMERYRKWKGVDYFSYPDDRSGFNVPGHLVENCIKHVLDARNGLFPTPYDYIMDGILSSVKGKIHLNKRYYLIGVDSFESSTMDHEIAHGLFYVNDDYKKKAFELVDNLPKRIRNGMSNVLLDMGYCEDVLIDEIQAYMSTGIISRMSKFKGIESEAKPFVDHFKNFNKTQ